MSRVTQEYPPDIVAALQNKQYSDAIEMCKAQSFNLSPIQEALRADVDNANRALDADDPEAAIDIYITTIGVIDPSNVLCRFFQPNWTRFLTRYLVELHKRGFATEHHTKLLFNLFHHAEERPRLTEFIDSLRQAKEAKQKFLEEERASSSGIAAFFGGKKKKATATGDIRFFDSFKASAAVDALIENDMEVEASQISEIMSLSKQIVKLLISQGQFEEAAQVISRRVLEDGGRAMLLDYGPALLAHGEQRDIAICQVIVSAAIHYWVEEKDDVDDQAFVTLFWGFPCSARDFLSKVVQDRPTPLFVNTLIELVIPRKAPDEPDEAVGQFFGHPAVVNPDFALSFIRNPLIPFDDINPLLFICTEVGFLNGVIALLKRGQRNSDLAALFVARDMANELYNWILEEPKLESDDWLLVLRYFAGQKTKSEEKLHYSRDVTFMHSIVSKVLQTRSLFALIEELCQNDVVVFEVLQDKFAEELNQLVRQLNAEEAQHKALSEELQKLDSEINLLETEDIEFKPLYCDQCGQKLSMPYVGFFCRHKIHEHCCAQADGHPSCPLCPYEASPHEAPPERQQPIELSPNGDILDSIVTLISNGHFS
jgi:hypothetical protein